MEIPKHIIDLVVAREWAIDAEYGLSQLSELFFNLETNTDFGALRAESRSFKMFSDYAPLNVDELSATELPENSIVELNLKGVMRLEDGLCSQGVQSLVDQFYEAYANPQIAGILLNVNSGGGDPQAGAELSAAIQDRNKPVVARTTIAGSAALLGIVAADEIIAASEFAKIGSIGAYASLDKNFLKYYAENIIDIYSDLSPNKNLEFRKLSGEGIEDKENLTERLAPLKSSLNLLAKNFQVEVAKFRKLRGDEATQANTLMGGMFTAMDAKDRGLIDSIGTKKYALKRVLSYK